MNFFKLLGVVGQLNKIMSEMSNDFHRYENANESDRKDIVKLQEKYIRKLNRQLKHLRSINERQLSDESKEAKRFLEQSISAFIRFFEHEKSMLQQKRDTNDEKAQNLYAKASEFARKALAKLSGVSGK
jgi:hypothetical protein